MPFWSRAVAKAAVAALFSIPAVFAAPTAAGADNAAVGTSTVPSPLTLQEAIQIALSHQPQQAIAADQVRQQHDLIGVAKSQYMPTLTPAYQYNNARQTVYGTGFVLTTQTGGQQFISSDQNIQTRGGTTTISLNQKLFDGGSREIANAQARRSADAARFGSDDTRQNVIDNVTVSYYQLMAAIDLVKVAQSTVTRSQETVDMTQAQIQAGTTAAKDIYQSQADLATAQVTLLQDQGSVRTSQAALKNAMGVETDDSIAPQPLAPGADLPPLPAAGQPLSIDEYYQEAEDNRPDLKQQQQEVDLQQLAVKQAKINAGLALDGSYALSFTPQNDIGARGSDSSVFVTASYPLFDGGSGRASVHAAEAARDAALAQLEAVEQDIRLDVEKAYVQRDEFLQGAQLAESAVQSATVNYNSAVASRQAGVGTQLDITVAQETLTTAQNQYVAAIYSFYIADAQLQKAIGKNG